MNLWQFRQIARLTFRVSRASRKRKLAQFHTECRPGAEDQVLDIGVAGDQGWSTSFGCSAVENFLEREYPWPDRITAVSVDPMVGFRSVYPAVRPVRADACQLPFADGSFDIVFSNAVIEHLGDRARQKQFIEECLRVARRAVFIAAPNRLFPYDVHVGLPLAHWLPRTLWRRFTSDENLYLLYPWSFLSLFPRRWKPRPLSRLWSLSIAVSLTRPNTLLESASAKRDRAHPHPLVSAHSKADA